MNAALRCVMGFTRSTPISAVIALSGELHFEFLQELHNIKFIAKHIFKNSLIGLDIKSSNTTNNLNTTYAKYSCFSHLPIQINYVNVPRNITIHQHIRNYSKENHVLVNRSLTNSEINSNSDKSSVFTDASIMNEQVGIGIYIIDTKERIQYKISQTVSIKCAEIFAMFMAIRFMISMGKENIIVYTDSRSSCISLQNTLQHNNDKFYEQKNLNLLVQNPRCNVTVQWIPTLLQKVLLLTRISVQSI